MTKKGFSLKGIFVQETEQNPSDNPAPATPTPTPAPTPVFSSQGASFSSGSQGGVFDQNIWDNLSATLEENSQPGFDYFKLSKSLKAMESIPLDEASKFKTVMATATATDKTVTVDKLLQSGQNCLAVIEKEKQEFNKTADTQYQTAVKSKETESLNIDKSITDKSAQIQQLTKEITDLQTKKGSLLGEASQAASKIEATKNNFNVTWTALKTKISEDLDKIKRYLST